MADMPFLKKRNNTYNKLYTIVIIKLSLCVSSLPGIDNKKNKLSSSTASKWKLQSYPIQTALFFSRFIIIFSHSLDWEITINEPPDERDNTTK